MRSTLLLGLYAGAVVCLPHAVASIDDAVQSNTTHMILPRSPMNPVGGSGSGSGSGSGQGTGTGKHPASPGECQGSPKRVKPDVETHEETCFRGAEIEDLLWYTTEKITETYGHDYSRGWDSLTLRGKGWQFTTAAQQDMNSLCPELEGLEQDRDTLRGRGEFNQYHPRLPVKAAPSDWETHSSQNELQSSYVNSYSRKYKVFGKRGLPSGRQDGVY